MACWAKFSAGVTQWSPMKISRLDTRPMVASLVVTDCFAAWTQTVVKIDLKLLLLTLCAGTRSAIAVCVGNPNAQEPKWRAGMFHRMTAVGSAKLMYAPRELSATDSVPLHDPQRLIVYGDGFSL